MGDLSFKASNVLKSFISKRKYTSDFVKKMQAIDQIPTHRLAWDSRTQYGNGRTYIRKIHGELS